MKVKTKAYGVVEADHRQRIYFPQGILGFEKLRDYVLLDAEQPPFYWLQSTEDVDVAFVLIDPRLFRKDYTLDIDPQDLDEIGAVDEIELLTLTIVTIPADTSRMTANLQGPIIINKQSKVGRQSISTNPKWRVKHVVMEELAGVEQTTC